MTPIGIARMSGISAVAVACAATDRRTPLLDRSERALMTANSTPSSPYGGDSR